MAESLAQNDSRWPHRLAVVLVCATFPLIWVGGLVTTYDAGMAVPDWPTTYGYNLLLYPWETWIYGPFDLFIEHGHRLLGAAAGVITIALVVAVWWTERRAWLRWLSLGALAAVTAQGVLGGMRVTQNNPVLAAVHGCFGPAFFALAVALAVVTSRRWKSADSPDRHPAAGKLHRLALLTTCLVYVQLVLGVVIRHFNVTLPPKAFLAAVVFHLLMAAVLLVHVALVAAEVVREHPRRRSLVRPAVGLGALFLVQLGLGGATWITNYGWPAFLGSVPWAAGHVTVAGSQFQALVTTGHMATGSLILVTALCLALRSFRFVRPPKRAAAGAALLTTLGIAG